MALALYRRYRPDTFDGVIGQTQVTVPLSRALDEGKLTHAYLFSGPRGCGKTSSARILARCINCEKGPTSHPCGECESCKDLATGGPGSIDVVEIDAASHNGVDDARELRERATFAPARDRYKIFILDEAHMVTQQGFNALLKIVEEPPEHVMFIFATTEPEKVIGTIRSRTHHYPFRLVPTEIMGPYLQDICEKEHIGTEPGVLKLAMRSGGGSMRDTLSVLDQLMVGSVDGVITHDSAVALLGFTPDALIGEAIDAVIERDGEKLYGVVQKVVVGGFDPRRFVEDLLSRVRDLLVLTLGGERAESVLGDDSAAEDMDHLHRQAAALGLGSLSAMAETINAALSAMAGAVSPRMQLELLAARLLAGRDPETAVMAAQQDSTANMAGIASGQSAGGAAQSASRGGFAGSNRRSAQRSSSGAAPATAPALADQVNNAPAAAGTAAEAQSADSANAMASNPGERSGSMPVAEAQPTSHTGRNAPNGRNPVAAGDEAEAEAASFAQTPNTGLSTTGPSTANPSPSPSSAQATQSAGPIAASANEATRNEPQHAAVADQTATAVQEDRRSVDERWDAAIAALPSDVREYVTRDKVVRVALASNRAGKQRISMTFDCPLSQHAFALAVSSDEAHRGHKASKVVLAAVREVFGANTMIAPTPVAANGEQVEPTARMSGERLAQVKQQIALAKAGLAAAGLAVHVGAHMPTQPKEHRTGATDGQQNADDPVHRGGREVPGEIDDRGNLGNQGEFGTRGDHGSQNEPNNWERPDKQQQPGAQERPSNRSDSAQESRNAAYGTPDDGIIHEPAYAGASADPWAQPAQEPDAASAAAFADTADAAIAIADPTAAAHEQTAPQPPAEYDEDPWAVPSERRGPQKIQGDRKLQTQSSEQNARHDPAAVGGTEQSSAEQGSASQTGADTADPKEARHHKQVSVPDTSDGVDPWAMPSAPAANGSTSVMARDASGDSAGNQSRNPSGGTAGNPYDGADYAGEDSDRFAGNTTASAAGDSYDDSDPWAASQNPIQRNLTRPNLTSRNPMPAGAPTRSDAQEAPGREQVAPEEDEYSLNDESLGSATALDLDELARLFEVKSVEDFAADDPRNPKNIQPPNKSGKHQEG